MPLTDSHFRALQVRRLGLGGAGIAVTFSLLGHASVAVFAAHHSRAATERVATLESTLAAFDADFVIAEDAAVPTPELPPTGLNTSPAGLAPHTFAARSVSVAATASTTTEAAAQPAAATPIVAQDNSGPHFSMTVAPTVGSVTAIAGLAVHGSGAGLSGDSGAAPIPAANADVPAKLRAGTVPAYTAAALSAGVEANVPLELVVDESGTVVSARVLEPVGYGLDEAARQGVLAYRFTPAMRGGKPVAVRMHWSMRFQLR